MTDILPRHVLCVLGTWSDFSEIEKTLADVAPGFELDREYSRLEPDSRMIHAFEASMDRVNPTMTDEDFERIGSHSAVAYLLSPPLAPGTEEAHSGTLLQLTGSLLEGGALAAKNESAGIAHGRDRWLALAGGYRRAVVEGDSHDAASALYWAWVRRPIQSDDGVYYSCGMHLLGLRDIEVSDAESPEDAVDWIDMMGLYQAADKPERPIVDGAGFRMSAESPRRIIRVLPCVRYEDDEFFFNPFGYYRLVRE